MIKRTQVKFFLLTCSVLFLSLAILFGSVCLVLRSFYNRSVISALEQIEKSYVLDNHPLPESIIIQVHSYSPQAPSTCEYSIISDAGFTTEKIHDLVLEAVKKSHLSTGNLGDLHYKLVKNTSIQYSMILYCSDMSEYTQKLNSGIVNTLIFTSIVFLILVALVWSLSLSIITPVKLAFDKQRQFISDASHELKTPIAVISANADILKNTETGNVFVDNIKSQTDRMQGLVSDLLTLAKIDEFKSELKHEVFDLSQEVTAITLPFDALAFEKGKKLNTNIEYNIEYKGDKESVKKLLMILLDNAIKHSDKQGIIDVSLKKDGRTTLTVSNTGSNVENEDSEKIFERFYRVDSSRSRDSGGSGLGLAIAKSIAETNNWKITAHSIIDKSMTITVVF